MRKGGARGSFFGITFAVGHGMRKWECMGSNTRPAVFDNHRVQNIAGKGITCEYLAYIYRNSLDFKHFLFILPPWLTWKNP
ncbi:MAG: hypothetical protein B1H13_12960 [Desulfobacteraceae bacterium 4484_190.3]|nr:MAG: hypothetical protein B1H13_12960 [Desulfobacteraceae bacterium 4484_190.3]